MKKTLTFYPFFLSSVLKRVETETEKISSAAWISLFLKKQNWTDVSITQKNPAPRQFRKLFSGGKRETSSPANTTRNTSDGLSLDQGPVPVKPFCLHESEEASKRHSSLPFFGPRKKAESSASSIIRLGLVG